MDTPVRERERKTNLFQKIWPPENTLNVTIFPNKFEGPESMARGINSVENSPIILEKNLLDEKLLSQLSSSWYDNIKIWNPIISENKLEIITRELKSSSLVIVSVS